MTKVQIIRRKSDFFLAQWEVDGTLMRAWVPMNKIEEQVDQTHVLVDKPEEWPPYGERWDLLFEEKPLDVKALDRELKRKDIWTIEDLQRQPDRAKSVLMGIYGVSIVTVLNTAAQKQQATGGNP